MAFVARNRTQADPRAVMHRMISAARARLRNFSFANLFMRPNSTVLKSAQLHKDILRRMFLGLSRGKNGGMGAAHGDRTQTVST